MKKGVHILTVCLIAFSIWLFFRPAKAPLILPQAGIRIVERYIPATMIQIKHQAGRVDTIFVPKVDTLLKPITREDSLAIIREFLRKVVYGDTLMDNDTAFIFVLDTLQGNRIKSREKIIRIRPIAAPEPEFRELYIGGGIGGGTSDFFLPGNITYRDKKNRLYRLEYDPFHKYVEISASFRIWKGKR